MLVGIINIPILPTTWAPRFLSYPPSPLAGVERFLYRLLTPNDKGKGVLFSISLFLIFNNWLSESNSISDKGRSFQVVTTGSSPLPNSETVDLGNSSPQSSLVICSTFWVETPLTTISIKVRINACSLRYQLGKHVGGELIVLDVRHL